MATIRIDVSDETLAAIERERAARGETQSEFVARAERLLGTPKR